MVLYVRASGVETAAGDGDGDGSAAERTRGLAPVPVSIPGGTGRMHGFPFPSCFA
jgi:hypothetical protein